MNKRQGEWYMRESRGRIGLLSQYLCYTEERLVAYHALGLSCNRRTSIASEKRDTVRVNIVCAVRDLFCCTSSLDVMNEAFEGVRLPSLLLVLHQHECQLMVCLAVIPDENELRLRVKLPVLAVVLALLCRHQRISEEVDDGTVY